MVQQLLFKLFFPQNISSGVDFLVVKKKRKGICVMPIFKALISELCRMVRTAVWTSLFCSILFGAKPADYDVNTIFVLCLGPEETADNDVNTTLI